MAAPTRVSGMVSGMDTESVVKAYVQSYIDKKDKIKQSQTKLTYKQDAWKALNTKVYSLYSKVGNLRFSNSYNLKKTTVSDATKATVSASAGAVIGTQSLKIKQLAKAGYLTGGQLAKNTTEDSTMASLGYTGGDTSISVRIGNGDEKTIDIKADTKISDVISQLKSAGVNASYDSNNRRIFVSAKNSGKDNDFAITANSASGISALSNLGLLTNAAGDMKGYSDTAAFAIATDGRSYYEKDAEGKAIVREGAVYDAEATKTNINTILLNLAQKYDYNLDKAGEIATLNSENASLTKKIEYSANKEIVVNADSQLIELLKKQTAGAKYVDSDGNYYDSEEDVPEGVEKTAIEDAIVARASDPEVGLITTDGEVEDRTAFENLRKAYNTYASYGGDEPIEEVLNERGESLTPEERAAAQATIDNNNSIIEGYNTQIADNKAYIAENSYWDIKNYDEYYDEGHVDIDPNKISELANTVASKIDFAVDVLASGISASAGATRVTAQDAIIELNEAEYTSSSSNFSINGLNISALAETGDTAITINTTQDNQGIYDKVKDFLSTYNEIINEMQSLYNADSAKGYNPLTDDQKEEMSEKEIEKWEDKIKSAILRRDSSLGNLITKMTQAMSSPIQINGRGYALSDFGIQTLGFLNAPKNEQYAYHIYGDEDDSATSSKEDKLMAMINSDPDTVIEYMQSLAANLYDAVGSEMKSTNLRSAYTVYNDKEMANDQKSYEKSIKQWEQKIADMEDRYYKKFSKMESTLAKLQSSTNALSGLMGQ